MNLDDTGANGEPVVRKPEVKTDYLYRFDESNIMYSEFSKRIADLRPSIFFIVKRTPCGAWIKFGGRRKFVNLKAKKRWACETEAEAAESYYARKRRQLAILRGQIDRVTESVETLSKKYPLDDTRGLTACPTCGHGVELSL